MRNLKSNEKAVYQAIVKCAADAKLNARNLIGLLIQSERLRYYRKLGRADLVEFIIKELKIDSEQTFALNRVIKCAMEFPELAAALESGSLHFSHATRVISKLDKTNVAEMVQFASTHTFAEVRRYVADANAQIKTRETNKRLAKDQTRLSMVVDDKTLELLARVQALEARRGQPAKMADALKAMARAA